MSVILKLYTKFQPSPMPGTGQINFPGWVGVGGWGWGWVLDYLKLRPTPSNLVKLGLGLSLAKTVTFFTLQKLSKHLKSLTVCQNYRTVNLFDYVPLFNYSVLTDCHSITEWQLVTFLLLGSLSHYSLLTVCQSIPDQQFVTVLLFGSLSQFSQ